MNAAALDPMDDAVLHRIAAATRLFCFLDYDGTLTPLAATPDAAVAPPGTITLLGALAGLSAVQVAIVTGRSIAGLRRFVDLPDVYYAGVHGNEIQLPDGKLTWSDAARQVHPFLPEVKAQLHQQLATCPGVIIEDKELALACHYRLAARGDAARAQEVVTTVAQHYQQRHVPIMITRGHEVIEIRPAGVTKGTAVRGLLRDHAPDALAIYIGDDETDEDAFALLSADAITIRVGPPAVPTVACYRIEDPVAAHRFLAAVRDRRRARSRQRRS